MTTFDLGQPSSGDVRASLHRVPEGFEVVKLTLLFPHHVEDDVSIILQNPSASFALGPQGFRPKLGHSLGDSIGDGFDVAIAGSAADDEEVGDRGLCSNV